MKSRTKVFAIALLAIAVSLIPHPARAADPTKVDRLLVVLKIDQQMGAMAKVLETSFERGFADTVKKKGLTQAEIDRARPVMVAAMKKIFEDSFSWEFFKPRIANVYAEELTDGEVDAAIAYYSSPQGQSMIAKLPVLMQRGAEIGMKRAQEVEPQMEATMDAALKQIRKDEAKTSEEEKTIAEKNVEAAEKAVKENTEKMDAGKADATPTK